MRADFPVGIAVTEARTSATKFADSISGNFSPMNLSYELAGAAAPEKCGKSVPMKMLVRWLRFNLVGGIGIVVQFLALFLMKGVLHCGYLAATALAVEAAVVHNFLWHERYTWADRLRPSSPSPRSSTEAQPNPWSARHAALKRCPTQMLGNSSCARFLRFNFTTGAVSIAGNLALMRVMVGAGHVNYLVANGIAIALCSLANFVVSEQWVFAGD